MKIINKIINKMIKLISLLGTNVSVMKGLIFLILVGRLIHIESNTALQGLELLLGSVYIFTGSDEMGDIS